MGNQIKKMLSLCFFLLLLGFVAGCNEETTDSAYHIEYLNKEKTKIVNVPYEPESTDREELIPELLNALSTEPEEVECRKTIPGDVKVLDYRLEGSLLTVYFDANYSTMNAVEEVLCRAAVVRTMTQIAGINCVTAVSWA